MEGTCRACGQAVTTSDVFCGSCGERTAPAPSAEPVTQVTTPAPGSRWPARLTGAIPADAAMGLRTTNSTYIGQRLLYDKIPEPSFDPLINISLLVQFVIHWFVYWAAYFVCQIAVGIVFGILSLVLGGAALTLWGIVGTLIAVAFACLFWLLPTPVLLSEWKCPVDGKAAAAQLTLEHISGALARRGTPLDVMQIRRLKLDGDENRDYLEIRRGLFTGFISCFGYGQDLYVGWTFWMQISPARYLLMFLSRIWQTLMRRGTDLHVTLRYDYARAMREAMHSVTSDGVDVAAGRLPATAADSAMQMQVAVSDLSV